MQPEGKDSRIFQHGPVQSLEKQGSRRRFGVKESFYKNAMARDVRSTEEKRLRRATEFGFVTGGLSRDGCPEIHRWTSLDARDFGSAGASTGNSVEDLGLHAWSIRPTSAIHHQYRQSSWFAAVVITVDGIVEQMVMREIRQAAKIPED
ncbi:hypothetical protein Plec18170_000554 [Paecilomyces lecythidis]